MRAPGRARTRRAALSRRAALVLVLAVGLAPTTSGSAQAHAGTLPDSAYYRSSVTSIEPAVPGLEVALDPPGESITLTNHTGRLVEVPGYSGEPYLRIDSSGVQENLTSLTSFLNGSLVIQGLPQQPSGQSAPPSWKQVARTTSYTWHDHRVHWMSQQRPPAVEADPGRAQKVFGWQVPLVVGGTAVTVNGELRWIGAPAFDTWQVTLLATGVFLALLVATLATIRMRRALQARGRRPSEVPT